MRQSSKKLLLVEIIFIRFCFSLTTMKKEIKILMIGIDAVG
jgi:hypothetical protein